jgi:hypothetical protein
MHELLASGALALGVGRASVRGALYMATHKPKKKLALTACMQKLLTILNAMVRRRTRWAPPAVLVG